MFFKLNFRGPQGGAIQTLALPLSIVYQDDDLLVSTNPPVWSFTSGWTRSRHPGEHISASRAQPLHGLFLKKGPASCIDWIKTPGYLVVAKNDFAQQALVAQFQSTSCPRRYWAICFGRRPRAERTIESYLRRHPQDRKRFASDPSDENRGKTCVTHYELLKHHPLV